MRGMVLTGRRENLYASPGLGKTAITLWALQDLPPVLVVAPKLVAQTVWPEEVLAWPQLDQDLQVLYQEQSTVPRVTAFTTVHPELLTWLIRAWGARWPYRIVVWDESTRLRGFRQEGRGTARAAAIEPLAWDRIESWINLSGTPSANTYLHLWGPQWFIDRGKALGKTFSAFKARWFYRPANGGGAWYDPVLPFDHAVEEMAERMKPTTRVLEAKDHFDLQPTIERTVSFHLPSAAQKVYDRMRRVMLAELTTGTISAANAGIKALKLRQISSGAVYEEGSQDHYHVIHRARLEAFDSIVEELRGHQLLVCYAFKHEADQVLKAYPGARELREGGAKSAWDRGELPMLLCHAASAGHGLNLQKGGHHLVMYTPMSDAELYGQMVERIGATRQAQAGSVKQVHIHHIEARVPIDAASRRVRLERIGWLQALMEALK